MIDSGHPDCQRSQRGITEGNLLRGGKAGIRLKTSGGKRKRTVSTFMEDVPTGGHIVVYAEEKTKTTHVKAKERWHPRIYTALCRRAHKLTARDTFTLSAHVFLGKASD